MLLFRQAALHQPCQVQHEQDHQRARGQPDSCDITVFLDIADDSLVDTDTAVDKDYGEKDEVETSG